MTPNCLGIVNVYSLQIAAPLPWRSAKCRIYQNNSRQFHRLSYTQKNQLIPFARRIHINLCSQHQCRKGRMGRQPG